MNTKEHESGEVIGRKPVPGRVPSRSKSRWKSRLQRTAGLVLVLTVGALLVAPPLQEKRIERRIRAALLAVQEGLQRYHVEEELYPKKRMSGHELVTLLAGSGFLEPSLINPWTGDAYLNPTEEDWLQYRTNGLAETYELVVCFPGSEEVQFRLDSTENQSLE